MKKCIFAVIAAIISVLVLCSFKETDDFFRYEEKDDGTIIIISFVGERFSTNAEIPGTIDGKTVTEIAESAFYGHKYVENVYIPSSIIKIGSSAFAYCESLKEVTFANGDEKLIIPEYCFEKCEKLKNVTFGTRNVEIDEYAFSDCISLGSVSFPASVTKIGYRAFFHCEQLIMKAVDCPAASEYAAENAIPTSFTETDNFRFIIIAISTGVLLVICYIGYRIIKKKKATSNKTKGN